MWVIRAIVAMVVLAIWVILFMWVLGLAFDFVLDPDAKLKRRNIKNRVSYQYNRVAYKFQEKKVRERQRKEIDQLNALVNLVDPRGQPSKI